MNRTDLFINHAVKAWKKGNDKLWIMASMANLAEKEGEEEWAKSLADELAVSTDTVYWYTVAYRAFLLLRREPLDSEKFDHMHQLRRSLSIKHFVLLSRAWKEYEFDISEAVDYLVTAGEERLSATHMQALIKAKNESDLEYDEWMSHFTKVYTLLTKYQNDYNLPERLRLRTKIFLRVMSRYGIPYK